jgi:hypothetical protein
MNPPPLPEMDRRFQAYAGSFLDSIHKMFREELEQRFRAENLARDFLSTQLQVDEQRGVEKALRELRSDFTTHLGSTSAAPMAEQIAEELTERLNAPEFTATRVPDTALMAELQQITTKLSSIRLQLMSLATVPPATPQEGPDAFENVVTARLEELIATRIHHMREEIRIRLEESVREEMIGNLRDEISSDEKHPLWETALRSVIEDPPDSLWNCTIDILEMEARKDVDHELWTRLVNRLALRSDVRREAERWARDEAMERMKREVREDPDHPLKLKAIAELKRSPEILKTIRQAVRHELISEVREQLKAELRPSVHAELESELRLALLFNKKGEIDGSVSSAVRRNIQEGMSNLREAVKDEIWETVVTTYFEALAAAEELDEDRWGEFLELATELVDDRLRPALQTKRRRLRKPDGFFRAIQPTTCDRTGDPIGVGDYYLVFRGTRIGLPILREEAEELVEQTKNDHWEGFSAEDGAKEPPWDGFPWEGEGPDQPERSS